jgi:signal transduction histidine kinase
MKADIRTRLMIRFTLIVTVILFFLSILIYGFSANYRRSEFYSRLENRAITTVRLLMEGADIDTRLLNILDRNSTLMLYSEAMMVYDNRNRKVYSNQDTLNVSEELLNRVKHDQKIWYRQGKKEALGLYYTEGHYHFVVIAMAEDLYGKRKLNFLIWILSVGFLVTILISFVAGRLYATQALRPISDMVRQVDRITFENLQQRLDEGNRTDEIARLAITFNKMLDRLVSALEMQKSFVSNASHELRTPLTSITGQIEVALMKTRQVEEYQAVLNSVLEDARDLNALSNGLLDMAKVSSDSSTIIMQPVRIDEILWEAYSELTIRKPGNTINIHFERSIEEERELTVKGNLQLLKSALYNLADNGCKFSDDHSVEIYLSALPEKVILKFTDKGIGIPEEEMGKILDPFYRAYNARNTPGSGLGLPLANRIILLHKGNLKIDSRPGEGTTITVEFPAMG